MTPTEAVLLVARTQSWVRESGGENRGEVVEHYLSTTGTPAGQPWCAAFVSWVGKVSLASWPLPLSASCQELANAAQRLGLLSARPATGAIFLLWRPDFKHFGHTGFLVESVGNEWTTIEGNTNPAGGREGFGVFQRKRTFGPNDRFIIWTTGLGQ
jgi:hypothetical protein